MSAANAANAVDTPKAAPDAEVTALTAVFAAAFAPESSTPPPDAKADAETPAESLTAAEAKVEAKVDADADAESRPKPKTEAKRRVEWAFLASPQAMLAADREERARGQSAVAYGVDDLLTGHWHTELPCPAITSGDAMRHALPDHGAESFAAELYRLRPALKALTWDGKILLAGGLVSAILTRRYVSSTTDADIFIIADDDASATAIFERTCRELYEVHPAYRTRQQVSPSCTTVIGVLEVPRAGGMLSADKKLPAVAMPSAGATPLKDVTPPTGAAPPVVGGPPRAYPLQLIHRRFPCAAAVLRDFDLGSCAVGWDGRRLVFSKHGLYAFSHGYNVLDETRASPAASPTYWARVVKYIGRGFPLLMPRLDLGAVRARADAQSPGGVWHPAGARVRFRACIGQLALMSSITRAASDAPPHVTYAGRAFEDVDGENIYGLIKHGRLTHAEGDVPAGAVRTTPSLSPKQIVDWYRADARRAHERAWAQAALAAAKAHKKATSDGWAVFKAELKLRECPRCHPNCWPDIGAASGLLLETSSPPDAALQRLLVLADVQAAMTIKRLATATPPAAAPEWRCENLGRWGLRADGSAADGALTEAVLYGDAYAPPQPSGWFGLLG